MWSPRVLPAGLGRSQQCRRVQVAKGEGPGPLPTGNIADEHKLGCVQAGCPHQSCVNLEHLSFQCMVPFGDTDVHMKIPVQRGCCMSFFFSPPLTVVLVSCRHSRIRQDGCV